MDAAPSDAPPCERAVLTLSEAADLLRIDADEVDRLAEQGEIPARRIGESWRFSCAALMAWLNGDGRPELGPSLTTQELAKVTARGTANAQAKTTPPASPSPADGQDKPIGEAPEERKAEDIFLRGQRVLLGRGEVVADFGQFYSRSDNLQLASFDNGVGLATLEQAAFITLLVGRVGVFHETELFASTVFRHQNDRAFLGSTNLAENGRTEFGGLGVGVRRTLLRESVGHPDIIATFDAQIPRGDIPYGLGGGLILVKSIDPVVLFANANYHRTFSRDLSNLTRLEPGNRFDVSIGYGLALNDTLAISTAASGLFSGTTTLDNATFRQSDVFGLRFALTSRLAQRLYIEPSVSFGMAGARNSFSLGVTIPYSF